MPCLEFAVRLVLIVCFTGCAYRPVENWTAATLPATDHEPASRRPNRLHNDKDPRYHAARAQSRKLSIFLRSQTFEYLEDGRIFASGEVTTGADQHPTPTGNFRVLSKDVDKRSGSYTNSFDQPTPMPYSLQFHGPYYIHEGYMPGHRDSHGCVRLHYEDAKLLFARMKVGDAVVVQRSGSARRSNPLSHLFPVF